MGLRCKNQDLRDERAILKRQFDGAVADNHRAVEEHDSTILDLWSLLERRNQELDGLDERTRLQLHSNEVTMSLVLTADEVDMK